MSGRGESFGWRLSFFVGLQASGKTSFYRARFAATHLHVSKDNFPNHRRPSKRQEREIRAALNAGKSLVVDNTNPTVEDRQQIITLAQELGAEVIGYFFESDAKACFNRNAARPRAVSNVGLFATAKKLVPPTSVEGFDELYFVSLSDADFNVERL